MKKGHRTLILGYQWLRTCDVLAYHTECRTVSSAGGLKQVVHSNNIASERII